MVQSDATASAASKPLLHGRYEVGRQLGQGNFSKVYYAKNKQDDGKEVAIKVLDKEKVIKQGYAARIKLEVDVLRRVRHPHIVRLLEVMATKGKIFFVMEFVRGGELFSRVAKGRLPENAARTYFQQLISAVAFCHSRGVYHRDIKPENLLLDDKGGLKVADFGLSSLADGKLHGDGLSHTFCGTPAYVAPEVLRRRGYEPGKADIWSCGVVLFVLMAGYLPFHDTNLAGMYRKIHRGTFRPPGWFSPELTKLLNRIFVTNPDTRITIPQIMKDPWFKVGFKEVKFYYNDDADGGGEEIAVDDSTTIHHATLPPPEDDANDQPASRKKPGLGGMKVSASTPALSNMASLATATAAASEEEEAGQKKQTTTPAAAAAPDQTAVKKPVLIKRLERPNSLTAFDIISFSPSFDLSGLFTEQKEDDGTRFVSHAPVSTIYEKIKKVAQSTGFKLYANGFRVTLESRDWSGGTGGALAIAVEIFELTTKLVVVEVKKKSGSKQEYEEFCNSELRPVLRSLVHDPLIENDSDGENRGGGEGESSGSSFDEPKPNNS